MKIAPILKPVRLIKEIRLPFFIQFLGFEPSFIKLPRDKNPGSY